MEMFSLNFISLKLCSSRRVLCLVFLFRSVFTAFLTSACDSTETLELLPSDFFRMGGVVESIAGGMSTFGTEMVAADRVGDEG